MKHINMKKRFLIPGVGAAVLSSALLLSTPVIASDVSFSGESNTVFRMRTTTDTKVLVPVYEYLRLNMTDNRSDGSGVSFYLSAWGRGDLADKSTSSSTNGDLQYAYLTYHAPKNNAAFTIGRQFISEGVATERIDGIFVRSDFEYGIGASVFLGNSVITEPNSDPKYRGGAFIYGGRVSQTDKKLYTIGLSALKNNTEDGSRYREEQGLDLWMRPLEQVDVTGRSTYNSITSGWMEHSYAVSYAPLSILKLGADFSHINFKDYLFNLTTPALSINSPVWNINNDQTAFGASASYTGMKSLTLAADGKYYRYDQSGDASYFGGKGSYSFPDALVVGGGLHRMQGDVDKLRYTEYRVFASKKIDQADLTIDAINVNYDKEINSIKNSYVITGAVGYEFNRKLKVRGDLQYSKNPDFNREVRVFLMATYTFDTKFVAEGRPKSEK